MKQAIKNKLNQAIASFSWKTAGRIFYCVLVAVIAILGFKAPDTVGKILEAVSKALLFML